MLALATSAAFQGYLQGGLASRMTESRVGSVRMDDSWRRTYNGKPPGTVQGVWSSSGSGAATAAPAAAPALRPPPNPNRVLQAHPRAPPRVTPRLGALR